MVDYGIYIIISYRDMKSMGHPVPIKLLDEIIKLAAIKEPWIVAI